jgi:hypothetical protein
MSDMRDTRKWVESSEPITAATVLFSVDSHFPFSGLYNVLLVTDLLVGKYLCYKSYYIYIEIDNEVLIGEINLELVTEFLTIDGV